ncbi:MAG: hypothetical protein H0T76_27600 [Nannocystis sp.]|nr:hypothetical protein [Nannocystis sp.]MBA3550258.1 hypothetical protein [Nannocystis sp.]
MPALTYRLIPPALLLLAWTGCGDNSSESTADSSATTDSSTSSSSSSSSGTGQDPTTGPGTDATSTDAMPGTTGDPTPTSSTGDPSTGTTTSDVTADCGFDDSLEFSRMGAIWQLRSEDGETCVWLERRDDSEPDIIYKAVPYTLLEFKAGHMGAVDHLTDQARMTWASTHHNWMDVAEAWDDSVRYRLEDKFPADDAFIDQFDLSAIDLQSKAVLWGPIRLHPHKP